MTSAELSQQARQAPGRLGSRQRLEGMKVYSQQRARLKLRTHESADEGQGLLSQGRCVALEAKGRLLAPVQANSTPSFISCLLS